MTRFETPTENRQNGHRKSRWRHVPLVELFGGYGNIATEHGDVLKTGHEPIHRSGSGECVALWTDEGRWWCSSCKGSGDAATYLMSAESIDYPDAAKLLAERFGLSPDSLPQIVARARQLRDITREALDALVASNDPPRIFMQEDAPVRLVSTAEHTATVQPMGEPAMRNELTASADFIYIKVDRKTGEQSNVPIPPPAEVVGDALAQPSWPFPPLRGLVDRPTLRRDGSLLDTQGYDHSSGLYLARAPGLSVPPVAEHPTSDDVAQAKALLQTVVAEFPFVSDADRATAFALGLLPFVREMIDGPSPLHMLEAPTPGVGKGLLADVLTHPSCGGTGRGMLSQARDDDEWRKRLLSELRKSRQAVQFDNLNRVLDSGSLCAVLTAYPAWSERLLGSSITLTVPVRCTWLATANNPQMSMEVARRTVRCRLDPKVERPWLRGGFHIERLFEWVSDRRGDLISANLTLARNWVAAGGPSWRGRALGSFERWSDVIGGVLEHAGIEGFLGNLDEFYDAADAETGIWREFVSGWWELFKDSEVGSAELFPLAVTTEGLDLGSSNSERAQQIRFGKLLAKQRDRVIGGYRVAVVRTDHHRKVWKLLPTAPSHTPTPPSPGNVGNVGECTHTPPTRDAQVRAGIDGDMSSETFPNIPHIPRDEPLALRCPACNEELIGGQYCSRCRPEPPQPPLLADEPARSEATYTLITDAKGLTESLLSLSGASVVALDIETAVAVGTDPADRKNQTALNPRQGRVRLVQLSTGPQTFVLDRFLIGDLAPLAPLFAAEGPILIGHNIKFDLEFLVAAGLPIPKSQLFDTMLAVQLLEYSAQQHPKGHFGLEAVAKRYIDIDLDKSEQTSDWSGPLSPEQYDYAARDASVLVPLAEKLRDLLREAELGLTAALERRALPAFVWLGTAGVAFDIEAWEALAECAAKERADIDQRLHELAKHPVNPLAKGKKIGEPLNWASTPQVKALLESRGHELTGVDEAALKSLLEVEPLAQLLLDRRDAAKRAGTYGDSVSKHAQPLTGRIHADWRQIGSRAGRTSCGNPPLQGVPRDKDYRACFRPKDGRVLVKADYSQIEVRVVAELSRDPRMLVAYRKGDDLHVVTAASVLGRENGLVTKDDRQAAKAVNFGLIYGMGAATLRQYAKENYGVALSEEEAAAYRERFRRTYSGLTAWQRRQGGAYGSGPIDTRTMVGRRRLGVEHYTEKLNSPVQGTAADGMKLALALLFERRDQIPSVELVLQIHDEIVIETDAADAERAKALLIACMVDGMAEFLKEVPVVVEPEIMRDWSGTPVEMGAPL